MNEPFITLSGNVAAAPTLRMAAGTPVTSFRVGATPRRYDKATDTWTDAETLWFTVTAWRALAEHCVTSIAKGDKVVVAGRLSQSTWKPEDGSAPRAGLEVDAASVGLDLSRSSALSARRSNGSRGSGDAEAGAAASPREEEPDWLSTGEVDEQTGEVVMVRAVPDRAAPEAGQQRQPAGV